MKHMLVEGCQLSESVVSEGAQTTLVVCCRRVGRRVCCCLSYQLIEIKKTRQHQSADNEHHRSKDTSMLPLQHRDHIVLSTLFE